MFAISNINARLPDLGVSFWPTYNAETKLQDLAVLRDSRCSKQFSFTLMFVFFLFL